MMIGRCRICGKLLKSPHPSGLCERCRLKKDINRSPDDVPDPLMYK